MGNEMDRVSYESLVVQDIQGMAARSELDLNPWYQRREVWNRPQKSYLINTIFEQKPIPTIYIRHSLDLEKEKSIKEVVDGQQRIKAILEYLGGQFAARHPDHKKLVRYGELSKSQQERLRLTSISVGYLVGATDPDVIEIFGRLNSISKNLNLQEKRNAKFGGEFKQFSLGEASKRVKIWRDYGIFSSNDIARMAEVQFVSELAINMVEGLQDYSASRIDKFYKDFDESFPLREELELRSELVFRRILSMEKKAITETIFSRAPLFFSLFLILDAPDGAPIPLDRLERAIWHIDERFSADVSISDRSELEAEFVIACLSNPHRIKSRQIRDEYIRGQLTS
ncbi:DUF262 domain-containing protein [Luteimonas sp. 100069]|uniref:DUF262 domain-containing protein n=1 Tax=Luteimonas sp. 100069 TaxID=2006109 RepID=UPI0013154F8D|nr:DUF262 domain-containing protein [Luteimonas sp. 100069]